jgi:glycosyltransferase involved in cell wall biosynthesis
VINCRLAEQLLSNAGIRTMHIHKTPDPGEAFIPPSEDSPIEYRYSTWFPQKEDMQKEMERSAYYISPRKKEGIGMSFLEAMAMGRCVLAHDHATMNEYIEHGKTGFLFDLEKPEAFDIKDVRAIQRDAYQFICEGHAAWEKEKHKIADWVTEPLRISRSRMGVGLALRFFKNPGNTIKVLWADSHLRIARQDSLKG